jgi:hypothetical protein
MAQNLIVGLVLVGAIVYLAAGYVKRRHNKSGCSHCAVANLQAASSKPGAKAGADSRKR